MVSRFGPTLLAVSIRGKILGMVAGLVLFLGASAIVLVRAEISRVLSDDLETRGKALARELATRSTDLMLTDNRFALHKLIRDALDANPDVRYVLIQSARKHIVAHSFRMRVPSSLAAANDADGKSPYAVQLLNSEEGLLTDVATPILNGRMGRVRVGLAHKRIDASLAQAQKTLGTAMGVALLLGLGLAVALTNVLSRPITELVSVARAVGRGELSVHASRHSADEFGELTRAFNAMLDSLARSRADLLQRVRELEALNAIAEAISGKRQLAELLQVGVERVLALTDLSIGWILLGEGPQMRLATHVGLRAGLELEMHTGAATGSFCQQFLQETDPRATECSSNAICCSVSPALVKEGLACHVCVPLVAGQRMVGMLNVAGRAPRSFTDQELRLLDSVGRQMGLAVENAALWEQLKGRETSLGQLVAQLIGAQEAERKRIARELHDDAGQLLAALSFKLQALEQTPDLPDAAKHFAIASRELLKSVFDEVHRLAVDLRPDALDQLGLVGALESHVREFCEHTAIRTDMDVSGLAGVRPSSAVEITVYRVVQEALANVRKHANSSRVGVLVKRLNGAVVAIVEDDGVGFDADGALSLAAEGHLGLFGMQERAALLGGRLTIESEGGRGTTVIVEIPLDNVQDSDSDS